MRNLSKALIVLFAVFCVGLAGVLIGYDTLFDVLPPSIAQRLPALEAPAPESLPAPSESAQTTSNGALAEIPGIEEPTEVPTEIPPTATPIPEPTATDEPIVVEEAATSTPLPTETPVPTEVPPTPTPTVEPLPLAFTLDGLANIPQTFNNCGPANLSIVLDYHGDGTTQEVAATALKPNVNDRNVSPWQIDEFVNNQTGMKSIYRSGGTEEMLKRLINAGLPPVVERGIDFNDGQGWYGHYLTLFGYDDDAQTFNAMNTYAKPWAPNGEPFGYDDVLSSWQHFNYTFYVVYPEAREAEVFEILGETLIDETAMWENAVEIAREQIRADGTDRFAWFNLGTSLTELGILTGEATFYEGGAAAFDEARKLELPYRMLWYQHRPYMAYFKLGRNQDVIDLANIILETRGGRNVEESYLWLGHALTAVNDARGAGDAYREALSVNANFWPAQIALDYLTRNGG